MGKLLSFAAEEPGEFRAETEEIREAAWQRYLDICEDADALDLSIGQMLRQVLLCRLSDRF